MNPVLKNILTVAAKNAVNAGLLAGIEIFHDPGDNNFHTWHGLGGISWLIVSAVLAREGMVWVPKLLKWSNELGTGA